MKPKPITIRLPGEELSPEQIAALKKKKAAKEAAARKPGILGRPAVAIGVLSLFGIVALWWLSSWLFSGYATGSIKGNVTCDGTPLPGGRITFIPETKGVPPARAMIDAQGNYSVASCPAGPCSIIVETFPPARPMTPPPKDLAIKRSGSTASLSTGTYVKLRPEFSDAATSPLKYTVTTGSQTHPVSVGK